MRHALLILALVVAGFACGDDDSPPPDDAPPDPAPRGKLERPALPRPPGRGLPDDLRPPR
jgi:hypothetical protein